MFWLKKSPHIWICTCLCVCGSRKKVRAEKSLNRRKSRTFFLSDFYPPIFFWFRWNQMCYRYGRPLNLIPHSGEWYDKTAQFNWNGHRKFSTKFNIKIVKTEFYVKLNKISIWDWTVILGDTYRTHPTYIEFSSIFVEQFP